MNRKFKIGDKVRIRTGLMDGYGYGDVTFYKEMYDDKIHTVGEISEIIGHGAEIDMYFISDSVFGYTECMLEKVDDSAVI